MFTPGEDLRLYLARNGFKKAYDTEVVRVSLSDGRITPETLIRHMAAASNSGRTLAQTLSDERLITPDEMFKARASVNQMGIVGLNDDEVEESLAHLIDSENALKWRVLPFSRDDLGRLMIAIADTDSVEVRDAVSAYFGSETVQYKLADESELNHYLDKLYDSVSEDLASSLVDEKEASADQIVVEDESTDSVIIKFVDKMIAQGRDNSVSDIHVETREGRTLIRFRKDGTLRDVIETKKSEAAAIIARLKHMAQMRADRTDISQDGHISFQGERGIRNLDLRVASLPTVDGEDVTMRIMDSEKAMMSLDSLGMSPDNLERYRKAINRPWGIALVTGPTGSGKSTTLYASMQEVLNPELKIISVEDPVEFRFDDIRQVDVSVAARAADKNSRMNFTNVLRTVLRSDPDIAMIGEIRDRETASTAIEFASTGHFLYSTLHTNSALASISRLKELGVSPSLLADTMEVIVAQRLIRRICPHCREQVMVGEKDLIEMNAPEKALEWVASHGPRPMFQASDVGCKECEGTGYVGRSGVHEVVRLNDELRDEIIQGAPLSELTKIARGSDMHSLYQDAFIRAWAGETSLKEIRRVVA